MIFCKTENTSLNLTWHESHCRCITLELEWTLPGLLPLLCCLGTLITIGWVAFPSYSDEETFRVLNHKRYRFPSVLVGLLGGSSDRRCYGRPAVWLHALSTHARPVRATGRAQGQPTFWGRSPAGDQRRTDWAQNTSLINTARKLWISEATRNLHTIISHTSSLTHLRHTNKVCHRENHTHTSKGNRDTITPSQGLRMRVRWRIPAEDCALYLQVWGARSGG